MSRINTLQSVFSVGSQTKLVFFILNMIFVNDDANEPCLRQITVIHAATRGTDIHSLMLLWFKMNAI